MRIIYWLLATTALIVSTFAQTPNGTRKAWNDTLWINRDGTYQLIGDYIKSETQTFLSYPDTNALALAGFDSIGTRVFLVGLSSSNSQGGGTLVFADSSWPEGAIAFNSATAGKQFVRQSIYEGKNIIYPEWFGVINDYDLVAKTGTDNAGAFQSLFDWAETYVSKWHGEIWLSAIYGISSTISPPRHVKLVGRGMAIGAHTNPGFAWFGGSADDTLMYIPGEPPGAQSYYLGQFKQLSFFGGNSCAYGIYFKGRADWDMDFEDVVLSGFKAIDGRVDSLHGRGACIKLNRGATNVHFNKIRGDNWNGHFIEINANDISTRMSIEDCTVDNGISNADTTGQFIFIDQRTNTSSAPIDITITGCQLEYNSKTINDAMISISNNPATPTLRLNRITLVGVNLSVNSVTGVPALTPEGFWLVKNVNADTDYNTQVSKWWGSATGNTLYGTITKYPGQIGTQENSWGLYNFDPTRAYTDMKTRVKMSFLEVGLDSASNASYPPLKFQKSNGYTLLAAANRTAGAVEYDGAGFYLSDSNRVQKRIGSGGEFHSFLYKDADSTIAVSGDSVETTIGKWKTFLREDVGGAVTGVISTALNTGAGMYQIDFHAVVRKSTASDTSQFIFYPKITFNGTPTTLATGDSIFATHVRLINDDIVPVSYQAFFNVPYTNGTSTAAAFTPVFARELGSGNLVIKRAQWVVRRIY